MGFPPLRLENDHAESWQQLSKKPSSTTFPGLLVLARVCGHSWMWAAPVWVSCGCSGDEGVGPALLWGRGSQDPAWVQLVRRSQLMFSSMVWVCLGV